MVIVVTYILDIVHHFTPIILTFLRQDLPPYSGGPENLLISVVAMSQFHLHY